MGTLGWASRDPFSIFYSLPIRAKAVIISLLLLLPRSPALPLGVHIKNERTDRSPGPWLCANLSRSFFSRGGSSASRTTEK